MFISPTFLKELSIKLNQIDSVKSISEFELICSKQR